MVSTHVDPLEEGALPPLLFSDAGLALQDLAARVEAELARRSIRVKEQSTVPELRDFLKLYTTRLPDPIDPDVGEVDYVVVVAAGDWTPDRVDAFISSLVPQRMLKGMPLFHIYSDQTPPPEVGFIFETVLAGVFEIMSWEHIEEASITSQDCIDLAAAGREILGDLYDVHLEPDDLQWLSVVNQLVMEEFRWFSDKETAAIPKDMDYVPHASLMVLGAVVGEAIRLNHTTELVWSDADGQEWPRLARIGSGVGVPIIDMVFHRFESGSKSDLWASYELLFASGRLSPPMSFGGEVDPLEFLPSWDPEPDEPFEQALATFRVKCREADLELEAHPEPHDPFLAKSIAGFTCFHEEQCYDLFVSTIAWDDEMTAAFLRFYGHRSFESWEMGQSPVFVFFSGHPLSRLLEYCFIQGPPVAPLEGLAQVETPSPNVPDEPSSPDMLALWLVHALELYTTIGLDLASSSSLPGLEFFLREDLRFDPELENEAEALLEEGSIYEPLALLVAVGMTAGVAHETCMHGCRWVWEAGASWPVMQTGEKMIDWVEEARAIWRGEKDEFDV
jgi:hypothetical protein